MIKNISPLFSSGEILSSQEYNETSFILIVSIVTNGEYVDYITLDMLDDDSYITHHTQEYLNLYCHKF